MRDCRLPSRFRTVLSGVLLLLVLAGAAALVRADQALDDYNLAIGLYKGNRWSLAAETFRKFVQQHPDHARTPYARLYLGLTLINLQEYKEARDVLRGFVKDYPQSRDLPHALYRVAEASYLLDDLPAARKELAAFLVASPDDPLAERALPYLGDVQLRLNETEAAIASFKQSLEKFPQGVLAEDAKFGLARAYEAAGKPGEATALYRELAANPSGARAAEAQFNLAARAFDEGRFAEAAGLYTALEEQFSESPLVPSARLNAGYAFYQDREFEKAAAQFELAAQNDTQALTANYWKGISLKAQGKAAEAAAVLQSAHENAGKDPLAESIQYQLADTLRVAGEREQARELFIELVRRWPKGELADDSLYAAGELALEAGNLAATGEVLDRFAREYPQSGLRLYAELLRGRLLMARGGGENDPAAAARQYATAALQFEKVLNESTVPRTQSQARYFLALARQTAGEHARALEAIAPLAEEVSKQGAAAEFGEALVLQAVSRLAQKDFEGASASAGRYLELFPSAGQAERALQTRAIAEAHLGHREAAQAALQELEELTPEGPSVPRTFQQVAEAAYQQEQWDWSGELFAALLKLGDSPYKPAALSGLGWSQYQQQKYEVAAETFGRLFKEHPQERLAAEAAFMRGKAYEEAGKLENASKAYGEAFAKFAPKQPSEAGVEQDGLESYAYRSGLQAARTLRRLKQIEAADAAYEALLKVFPRPKNLDRLLDEWALLNYEAERYERADDLFRRLVEQAPESDLADNARLSLAESELVSGNLDAARASFERLAGDPKADDGVRERSMYQLVAIAVEQQKWPDVLKFAEALESRFPDGRHKAYAQFYTAEALVNRPRPESPDLDRARQLLLGLKERRAEPAIAQADWLPRMWVLLAEIAFRQQRYDDVVSTVADLKQQLPESPFVYQANEVLGRSYKQQAKFGEAREAFEQVVNDPAAFRTPTAAKAQLMIAETHFLQESYKQAFLEYQKVYHSYKFPEWQAPALFQSGVVDEKLNNWKQAVATYEKLLQEFPNSEFAAQARQRLEAARQKAAG